MATIRVKFRPSTVEGRMGTIYYSIVHQKYVKQISSAYKLYPMEWDSKKQIILVSRNSRRNVLFQIQQGIQQDMALLKYIAERLNEEGGSVAVKQLVEKFKKGQLSPDFFSFMDARIGKLHQNRQYSTELNYIRTRTSFREYYGAGDLYLSEITSMLLKDYENWLKSRGVTWNTISFYMRILRSVYNKAVESNMVVQVHPFRSVYTGVEKTRKRAVDKKVIRDLKQLELSQMPDLEITRDLFLFSVYSRGMAFVDMAFLRKNSIKNNTIYYRRQKTGQQMQIRIEACLKELIDKYQNSSPDYILPVISTLQEEMAFLEYKSALNIYNKRLQRLSRMLGLERSLTSYVSRHTWADMAHKKNIPLSVISESMGHTTEKTTRIYLAGIESSVIDDANCLVLRDL